MSQIGAKHNEATHIEATPVAGPKIRKIKRVVLKISEKKQKAASAADTSAADTSAADTNEVANAEGVVSTSEAAKEVAPATSAVVLRTNDAEGVSPAANTFSSKSQARKWFRTSV